MRKLRLEVEALEVESFEAGDDGQGGTVLGHSWESCGGCGGATPNCTGDDPTCFSNCYTNCLGMDWCQTVSKLQFCCHDG